MTLLANGVTDRQIRLSLNAKAGKRESRKADPIQSKLVPRKTSRAKTKATVP